MGLRRLPLAIPVRMWGTSWLQPGRLLLLWRLRAWRSPGSGWTRDVASELGAVERHDMQRLHPRVLSSPEKARHHGKSIQNTPQPCISRDCRRDEKAYSNRAQGPTRFQGFTDFEATKNVATFPGKVPKLPPALRACRSLPPAW